MQHFPIFVNLAHKRVVLSGGGEAALAKLRLLLKTQAQIAVFAADPAPDVLRLAAEGRLELTQRALAPGDVAGAVLFYAADEDATEDARTAAIAQAEGALFNVVDNLAASAFITPAIVDRDPVVVAIGTEGAAPVLARKIKAEIEARLSPRLGLMARIGKAFRAAAEALPHGAPRRDFWAEYYNSEAASEAEAKSALHALLARHLTAAPKRGHVDLVDAGPGDPDLLTLRVRKALDSADVIVHDRAVAPAILDLVRREAMLIEAGSCALGSAPASNDIRRVIADHAGHGLHVIRLYASDQTGAAPLDKLAHALKEDGVSCRVLAAVPLATAAQPQVSLPRAQRAVRFLAPKAIADHAFQAAQVFPLSSDPKEAQA